MCILGDEALSLVLDFSLLAKFYSSKVWVALSLINMNNDFAFVSWALETPCVFHFRGMKFHYVKETHMMKVAF